MAAALSSLRRRLISSSSSRFVVLLPLLGCILLVLAQFQKAIQIQVETAFFRDDDNNIDNAAPLNPQHRRRRRQSPNSSSFFSPIPSLPKNQSFGACLMVKDDNDLLYEWLAYHYTVLPLRYVLVASDIGSTTQPDSVLERWKTAGTGLEYWSVPASNFTNQQVMQDDDGAVTDDNNTSTTTTTAPNIKDDHHHALVARQREFIPYCIKFMKAQGVTWISLIDTDEFVVINPIGTNESLPIKRNSSLSNYTTTIDNQNHTGIDPPNAVEPIYHELRTHPSLVNSYHTNKSVLDIIHDVKNIKDLSPCYTMPRVLHGAIPNLKNMPNNVCQLETRDDIELARELGLYQEDYDFKNIFLQQNTQYQQQHQHHRQLQTLTYHRHARTGDFSKNKFGKVFLDVSQLSDETIQNKVIKSPHRPYKPECRPGVVHFPEALFYINHYIGSWDRYAARKDSRRNREEWEKRAFIIDATSCDKNVTRWFSRFVDLVGRDRAQFLLGKGGGGEGGEVVDTS